MGKIISILLAVLMIASAVFAFEAPLSDYGFEGVLIQKAFSTNCADVNVLLNEQEKAEVGEGILSINATFSNYQNDSSYVSVSINDGAEKVFWPEYFSCKQNCWARIFIPNIRDGAKIRICTVLGGSTEKVEVAKESFIGLFDTPVLSIENVSPNEIFLGERAKMSIVVSNKGTKTGDVFVQFVHPDTRARVAITSLDIVEGDSSATTSIAPGETRQFVYYIKPTVASSYNLPSAALFFTNVFGEEQSILSSHPQMSVLSPNQLEVSLVALTEEAPYKFKVMIKNNWNESFNGVLTISPQTAFDTSTSEFLVLGKSEKELDLQTIDLQSGKYTFFATVTDTNNIYTSNKIELQATNASLPFGIIFAIVGIIIGLAIFAWIYFVKEK